MLHVIPFGTVGLIIGINLPNGFHSWLSQLVVLGKDSRLHMDAMEVCGSLKKHATQTGHGVREN